jgi:hypothetical protein
MSLLHPRIQAAIAHVMRPKEQSPDGLDWARRIMAKYQRGEKVSSATLLMAREALAGRGNRHGA